jgi:hypothetical protein
MLPTRVALFGLGAIGREAVRLAGAKPRLQVVGAVDRDPAKAGRSLAEVAGLPFPAKTRVHATLAELLAATGPPQVLLHTATSHAALAFEQVRPALEAGTSVVSTCEELIFPRLRSAPETDACDALCRRTGARLVATGVNPGFAMDLLPILASAVSREVTGVYCSRVVDAATRRRPLQAKIGCGLDPDEFRRQWRLGAVGHAGFRQSLALIAHALGWQLDGIDEACEPVIATEPVQTPHFQVEPGQTRGLHQRVVGIVCGVEAIELDLTMALGEPDPHDTVRLGGRPPLELTIPGGTPGDDATVAHLINVIPRLLVAAPGVRLLTELPMAAPEAPRRD